MHKKQIFSLFIALLVFVVVGGCEQEEKPVKISLKEREVARPKVGVPEEKPLRIGLGAMITPVEGYNYYWQLIDYISEKLGRQVEMAEKVTYAETNNLLRTGKIDFAFVCSGPYVDGHDEFGMELLVAPQAYGDTVYYSYIIVYMDSPIESFSDLRGKSFAFVDPMSNTGKLVPTYMLARMGETPESFFHKHIYTYSHDKSIKAVARNIVDGAAVDSLIWEYLNHTNPVFTSKTRVIEKSPPYGIPPVVARPGVTPEMKERIKQIFLNANKDKKGREILKGMAIDKFVLIDDSAYDTVREMESWLAEK